MSHPQFSTRGNIYLFISTDDICYLELSLIGGNERVGLKAKYSYRVYKQISKGEYVLVDKTWRKNLEDLADCLDKDAISAGELLNHYKMHGSSGNGWDSRREVLEMAVRKLNEYS